MTKEVTAIQAGRREKHDLSSGLSVLSLSILLLALLGAIVAASSKAPVIWMLVWPAPLILIFTAARFIREGYHKRDGVLVLGRRAPSPPLDLSAGPDDDKAQDDAGAGVEEPVTIGDLSSVLGTGRRIEVAKALELRTRRETAERRSRLEKRLREGRRSLAGAWPHHRTSRSSSLPGLARKTAPH